MMGMSTLENRFSGYAEDVADRIIKIKQMIQKKFIRGKECDKFL